MSMSANIPETKKKHPTPAPVKIDVPSPSLPSPPVVVPKTEAVEYVAMKIEPEIVTGNSVDNVY